MVALVVLAGAAFLLGVAGVLPGRVSWGKNLKIDLRASTKGADAQALETPPAELAQIAQSAIADAIGGAEDGVDLTEAARLAEHALFNSEIMAVVAEIAAELGAQVSLNGVADEWWNTRVEKAGKAVFLAIRLVLDEHVANRVRSRASMVVGGAAVLVVVRELDEHALRFLGPQPPAVITWEGNPGELRSSLAGLLGVKMKAVR
ncbi:hypothetical protein [Amycolatopsis sp. Hca4]|uniref:hypothetical protein n=1 Tax=Amycolatopsis sp. Hca4 TaxID=2742131 RepID=UPI001590A9AB|nr:hypothetical protein [Amycolatopsis sp. Hca4]QKV73937.1 hypothetical protein HUT10_09255 [Amycolatopsis sp. Hca4]